MTVYDEIDSMNARASRAAGQRASCRIHLYSEGTKAKLKNAQFALSSLKDLTSQTDAPSASGCPEFQVEEKVHFYVDSFFAFLYSTFDVISHVVNQALRLRIDEDKVSFNQVKKELDRVRSGSNVQQTFSAISRSDHFKNLDKYRNCSTHRRQIYIKVRIVTTTETPGYSASGVITTVERVLCDDPLNLRPSLAQNRELLRYCSDMLAKVESSVVRIARTL